MDQDKPAKVKKSRKLWKVHDLENKGEEQELQELTRALHTQGRLEREVWKQKARGHYYGL